MKTSTKFICAAAGLAGAFLLGGTASVLLMEHCKAPRICSFFPCDHAAEQAEENDIPLQETCASEVNCSEE